METIQLLLLFPYMQTSMSVTSQLVPLIATSVLRTVITTSAPTPAAVMMDTLWTQMAEDAMVSIQYTTATSWSLVCSSPTLVMPSLFLDRHR